MLLQVEDPKTSEDFVRILHDHATPLPWQEAKLHSGQWCIIDAEGQEVCRLSCGARSEVVAAMLVVAVNTCGSFKAVRE
jgi:hypothetical protein